MLNYNVESSVDRGIFHQHITNQMLDVIQGIQFPYSKSKHLNVTISRNKFVELLLEKVNTNYISAIVDGGLFLLFYKEDFYVQIIINSNKRTDYYTYDFGMVSNKVEHLDTVMNAILEIEQGSLLPFKTFNIKWHFSGTQGIDYAYFEEPIQEDVNELAYPYIPGGVTNYIDRYLESKESVLILIGDAGVGKTTLIRYIIGRHNELKALKNKKANKRGDASTVFYTSDTSVLEADDMFINFATSDSSIMVLEDIDLHLSSRSDGNVFMYKLLSASDGLIKNMNRKIIISTNLPSVGEIDEALIRKGRCFGVMEFRKLLLDEALNFLKTNDVEKYETLERISLNKNLADKEFTLAELYSDEFYLELEQ